MIYLVINIIGTIAIVALLSFFEGVK